MKTLITYLARSLAGRPEEVEVNEIPQDKGTLLELVVADEDLNHLIGKQGRTIRAMRILLAASSSKNKSGAKYFLKIRGDSENGPEAGSSETEPAADSGQFGDQAAVDE